MENFTTHIDALSITATAVGLSMDALAVSIAHGATIKELQFRNAFQIALSFGLFQAIMPVLGWLAGRTVAGLIRDYDHWVALGLLGFIGVRMIVGSRCLDDKRKTKDCRHLPTLLLLSIATSIDALAIGLSFAFLQTTIVVPVVIIGGVTFAFCLAGVYVGNRVGHFFEKRFEFAGGLILIGIGVKIAVEHIALGI